MEVSCTPVSSVFLVSDCFLCRVVFSDRYFLATGSPEVTKDTYKAVGQGSVFTSGQGASRQGYPDSRVTQPPRSVLLFSVFLTSVVAPETVSWGTSAWLRNPPFWDQSPFKSSPKTLRKQPKACCGRHSTQGKAFPALCQMDLRSEMRPQIVGRE